MTNTKPSKPSTVYLPGVHNPNHPFRHGARKGGKAK